MQGRLCLRDSFAVATAGCRDLQQGSCSEGRAQLPPALPRALGLLWGVLVVPRGGWQCPGVTGTLSAPRGCWSRCQPRCRFKATPGEQMITGQLRLHNLFWV